jgi:hypothetical protein
MGFIDRHHPLLEIRENAALYKDTVNQIDYSASLTIAIQEKHRCLCLKATIPLWQIAFYMELLRSNAYHVTLAMRNTFVA